MRVSYNYFMGLFTGILLQGFLSDGGSGHEARFVAAVLMLLLMFGRAVVWATRRGWFGRMS